MNGVKSLSKAFTTVDKEADTGWLKYPRDSVMRRDLYGDYYDQVLLHPAKQNAYVFKDIMEYVSVPGETILDPFGGIGTTTLAAIYGRNVVLIEVEQFYADIAKSIADYWHSEGLSTGAVTVICQDNRQVLPFPCDHIVTSPPYGNDMPHKGEAALKDLGSASSTKRIADSATHYTDSALNIGTLNKFLYVKTMDKLYKKMVASLNPNGTISITHRDRIEDGKRILYSMEIIRAMVSNGMELELWEKWKVPLHIQGQVNKKIGNEIVEDEDILIFRKLS